MKSNYTLIGGLVITASCLILMLYANIPKTLTVSALELEKSTELDFKLFPAKEPIKVVQKIKKSSATNPEIYFDSAHKKILLIGDSQAGGIVYPFNDYCQHNGHTILKSLVWYSASDITYASNDTLSNLIKKYKPNYIVVVIGLNQVFQSRLSPSEKAVQKILSTFGDIPYAWIGPASWIMDKGISQVYSDNVEKGAFFLSANLVLGRGGDGRHPNREGYRIWMDSVANWLNTSAKWKLRMTKPVAVNLRIKFPLETLNASRRKANQEKPATEIKSTDVQATIDSPALNN